MAHNAYPVSLWSWPVVAFSCFGAAMIVGAFAPVQPSASHDELNLQNITNISVTSYAPIETTQRPTPRIETRYSASDFLSTYRFWSDEMILGTYASYWSETQEMKLQNGGKLSERTKSLYGARFSALWAVMTERALIQHSDLPERALVSRYLHSSAASLAELRLYPN